VCHNSGIVASTPRATHLTIGPQGRVVIPADLRRELGLEPGTPLVAHVEEGRLVLERRDQILRRMREELRGSARPGSSTVDDLIAERREEARRESRA
jgi:AbrB family looped-hinge helix DNA binding protein